MKMKTPDDIKKGLQYCSEKHESCNGCTYLNEEDYEIECLNAIMVDALAYIQQLESRLAQVERERDAAVNDLADSCKYCKHTRQPLDGKPCNECMQRKNGNRFAPIVRTKFEWRGVCEENTKED